MCSWVLGCAPEFVLSLDAQVSACEQDCICTVKTVPGEVDLATVTHALVTSRLGYCNVLYMELPLESARKLQWVQNVTHRLLTGAGYRNHISPITATIYSSV